MTNKKIGGGLKPLPFDERDYKFGNIFGTCNVSDLPKDFMVAPIIKIEDQLDTDYCTACASTSVREDQEGKDLDYLFVFCMAKQNDPNSFGCDLRTMCEAHCKYGALLKKDSPYDVLTPRSVIVDKNSWDKEHFESAKNQKALSYARILPQFGKDMFDSIRCSMWVNRKEKKSVFTGNFWEQSWTDGNGIIDKSLEEYGSPHAFKIGGWKTINNKPYLVAVLSNGTDIGDKGVFYMSREVVNSHLEYGCFTFTDMPKVLVKTANKLPFMRKLILALNVFFKK